MSTSSKRSSSEQLADRLIALTGRIQRRLRRSYHVTRLTPARLAALGFIVSEGRSTSGQLAQAEAVTAPTMTRILDALEHGGFITRSPSASDRRIIDLEATAKGRSALDEVRAWQVSQLAGELDELGLIDRSTIHESINILERLGGPSDN